MYATKLIEAGTDWMTATSRDEQTSEMMDDTWNLLLDHEHIAIKLLNKSGFQGYAGVRAPHMFYGSRGDERCVILSSGMAWRYSDDFLAVGARPSRLDIQVTGTPGMPCSQAVEQMYKAAVSYKKPGGQQPAVKMFVDREGPEGLYVGRRASQIFLRIYDKGKESKQEWYKGCLRVEVELKQEAARHLAGQMVTGQLAQADVPGLVAHYCEERGIPLPFPYAEVQAALRAPRRITPIESKASWIMKQVSPTIQALIEEVGWGPVVAMLFPDGIDKHSNGDTM